jgi:ubiquinone/menaquinone biosynthesis C-methylase UbiE
MLSKSDFGSGEVKSNAEWKAWGKQDPLFGVAAWPGRERAGANPWTDSDFYALGQDWHDFDAAWQRTVGYEVGTVLEIGSGAGRITRMLSSTFAHVIATDVSADILEYARAHIAAPNISWQVSDGDHLPTADRSVDAVFSCHVFQHFPSNADQLNAFKEIRRVLKPGGTFFIHLSIHVFPQVNGPFSRAARVAYAAFLRLLSIRAALRRLLMRVGYTPYMHGVSYELQSLLSDLKGLGFIDLAFSAIMVRTGKGIHCCVSARKLPEAD